MSIKLTDLTPEQRVQEKQKLQQLVKDFAKDAVNGLPLNIIDMAEGKLHPVVFHLDQQLSDIEIQYDVTPPKTALYSGDISMGNLTSIYRSGDVLQKHAEFPLGAEEISQVVGLSYSTADGKNSQHDVLFYFPDHLSMERFFVCMKILRLSASIALKRLYTEEVAA
eukprot:GHVS01047378.1.p1 GENE.GHVS01047378.1~~GHVS01047378.1.p1  ORF type:complete len:166 (+),score=19.83 GHVS01047378.1:2-499(+)